MNRNKQATIIKIEELPKLRRPLPKSLLQAAGLLRQRKEDIEAYLRQQQIEWHPRLPLTGKERLKLWEQFQGIWKNKKPDPIKMLKKMRREWERKLPSLNK